MDPPPTGDDQERFWHDYLTRGDAMERRVRRIFRVLPHEPRCQLCAAPFAGAVAPVMRALGKRPADKNPRVCQSCFSFMAKHHGGAEIEASFMFADIRGSTTLAERMSAAEFHALLDRFYATASNAVFEHDGGVDKFVGDEVVAMYFPLMSGHGTRRRRSRRPRRCSGRRVTRIRTARGSRSGRASTPGWPGSAPWVTRRTPSSQRSATPSTRPPGWPRPRQPGRSSCLPRRPTPPGSIPP